MDINDFDFEEVKHGGNIIIIGPRSCGKSFLEKKILNEYKYKIIFSCNSKKYNECIDDKFIYDEYDTNQLMKMIDINKIKKQQICIVLNNCLRKNCFNDQSIKELIFNGDYYNFTTIISTLDGSIIPLSNVNRMCGFNPIIFLFRDNNVSQQLELWKKYANFIPSFDHFKEIFEKLTHEYGCMVISKNLIYHYKN